MSWRRRDVLTGLGAATTLGVVRPAWAFGESTRVDIAEIDMGPGTISRPSSWKRLLYDLGASTSVEHAKGSVQVSPEDPEMFEHPFCVLVGDGPFAPVSDKALEQLSQFLAYGGFLFIDDTTGVDASGFDGSVRRLVRRLFPTRPLSALPGGHSVMKAFFLLDRVPGRLDRQPYLEGVTVGNLCPLMYGRNDLSGALQREEDGRYVHACVPGGERQRREASKVGINLVMYALTANYKNDQAHVKALMEQRSAPVTTWLLGGDLGPAGRLVWTAPDALVLAAVVGALVALVAALRGKRPGWALVLEGGLWALALVGVVVALARPVWVEEEGRTEGGRVAVLVDGSASMSVREGDQPRSVQADAVVERLLADGAEVFTFGDDLTAGAPSTYDLPGTDLEAALLELRDRFAGETLASVVVVTDGIDRGLLRERWQDEGEPVAPELSGPLTIFQVGEGGQVNDLAVQAVETGGYAYVHTPFRLKVELAGLGFGGRTVSVDLSKDGGIVARKQVTLGADGSGNVTFEVTPDRAGRFSFLVSVPDYEDDAVQANNAMPVVVRVVRDKIRVLQVAGSPSWDVKFLRRFLKGDPSVDLVSFFILRTRRDLTRRWGEDELSLIQFPYRQLFTEDLKTFDLVVFQNFDYAPYFEGMPNELLDNLAGFVKDGHGIVMVGGDRSFSQGGYGGTPLGDVLPVEISRSEWEPDPEPFLPGLTDAGRRHPVTRLQGDPAENVLWWSRLHTLDGTNTGLTARKDAAVLLEHPTAKGPTGQPVPVLAVREVGEGRTMSLSVDTSWRWSLSEAAVGRGNQAYLRFWKSAMRWLVQDPTTARVTVDTPRENYRLGDDVRIVVEARDADFAPLAGGTVEVLVKGSVDAVTLEAETGKDGEAVAVFTPTRRGAHRVEVVVRSGTREVGVASTVFAVTSRDPELDEVAPDDRFLQWLAARTGGRYVAPGESARILRDEAAGRTVWDREEVPVWRSPLVALWIGLFAGLAWLVRRRVGLR